MGIILKFHYHKIFSVILILNLISTLNAAFENKGGGGGFIGAGSSGIASEETAFSEIINPAKIYFFNASHINLYYRNFYLISGLDQIAISSNFFVHKIPIGISIDRFGNKLYSEYTATIGSSIKIIDSLAIGYKINFYHLQIKNYGSASSYGFSIAAFYKINRSFRTGFIFENISESKIGNSNEKIPMNLALAFSYNPVPEIELNFDIFKDNRFDFEYRAGLYYTLNKWFKIMAGFRSEVNSFSGGIQIKKYNFSIVYAVSYHSLLGISNTLSMGYEF